MASHAGLGQNGGQVRCARPLSRRKLIDSIERALVWVSAERQRQAGEPSKTIAADLRISQRTAERHRARIMHLMGVRAIPDLVRTFLSASPA